MNDIKRVTMVVDTRELSRCIQVLNQLRHKAYHAQKETEDIINSADDEEIRIAVSYLDKALKATHSLRLEKETTKEKLPRYSPDQLVKMVRVGITWEQMIILRERGLL